MFSTTTRGFCDTCCPALTQGPSPTTRVARLPDVPPKTFITDPASYPNPGFFISTPVISPRREVVISTVRP